MSESVKIGGIGKNPAIDKVNNIQPIDMGNYITKRMEELIYGQEEQMTNNMQDLLPHFPVEKIKIDKGML